MEDLTRTQLLEAVQTYPWFAAARVELCLSIARESGIEAAAGLYRESLAFLPDGALVARIMHNMTERSYADADLKIPSPAVSEPRPRMILPGMDFFSKEDYENERTEADATLGNMAIVDYSTPAPEPLAASQNAFDIVSETLAQIYADQGYPELAKEVYTKLSLQSPEKSAYFATLIEKLK